MTRDGVLHFQSFELCQSLDPGRHAPAGRRRFNPMVPDGNLGVEEEIAGKQGARLGQPRHAIAGAMRSGKIEQLHLNITNEQGQLILEGQRGRSQDHIAHQGRRIGILAPTSQRPLSMGNEIIADTAVRDDRTIRKYLVPKHMIAVEMRIEKAQWVQRPVLRTFLCGACGST
jgi:hypothetical protein